MKKLFILFLILPICSLFPQSLEEVLQKHHKAVNQEKLSSIQTVILKGKILQGGMEMPMTMYRKRPDKVRMETSFSGMTFIQTYDGTKGWSINPFSGSAEPLEMKSEELVQAKSQADIDGYLVDYEKKGFKLQLLPGADTSAAKAHVVSVTLPDSSVVLHYIDPGSGYLIKQKAKATVNNLELDTETSFSDFKTVNGIAFPHKMEITGGQTLVQIIFEDVQFGADVADSLFGKPEAAKN